MPHRHRRSSAAGVVLSACLAATVFAGCTEEEYRAYMEQQASGARVERVLDGDTVVLSGVGTTRLIGVDAPEEGRCGGTAATRFTRRRLEDARVKVERGEDGKDAFRRTLAYLRRGGTMHNLALVEEGYAKALTVSPNNKYAHRFEAAEKEAKQQDEGPLADCAAKRERARASERDKRAERAERLARQLRAAERREKAQQRRDRGDRGGAGGSDPDPTRRYSTRLRPRPSEPDEPRRRQRRAGM